MDNTERWRKLLPSVKGKERAKTSDWLALSLSLLVRYAISTFTERASARSGIATYRAPTRSKLRRLGTWRIGPSSRGGQFCASCWFRWFLLAYSQQQACFWMSGHDSGGLRLMKPWRRGGYVSYGACSLTPPFWAHRMLRGHGDRLRSGRKNTRRRRSIQDSGGLVLLAFDFEIWWLVRREWG